MKIEDDTLNGDKCIYNCGIRFQTVIFGYYRASESL